MELRFIHRDLLSRNLMAANWKEASLAPTATIKDAVRAIDTEGLKIALVLNADGSLAGTVTDGDIRRGLLRQLTLDDTVEKVMNTSPITCPAGTSLQTIKRMLQEKVILHMPLIEDGLIVDLITWDQVSETQSYGNPVVLMAGGFGTRLRPLTESTPKPLLKVGSKPVLERTLERFIDAGFTNFYISLHYLPEQISSHFGDGSKWGVTITYMLEEEPLGTGGALGLLPENSLGDDPIFLMNADLLTEVDLEQLLLFHQDQDAKATMCVREYGFQVPYGVVEVDDVAVRDIVEKPEHRFLVNAGIYVLDPSVVRSIESDTRIDMPEVLSKLMAEDQTVVVFPIHEYWLDIGQRADFDQAQNDYSTD